jgi:uncharacterized protein (TIGR03437 family)
MPALSPLRSLVGTLAVPLLLIALGVLTSANAQTPIPTTITVTSAPNPSSYGQNVTFVATVSAGGSANPTGTVQFRDGSVLLGTPSLNSGTAQFRTPFLAHGVPSVTASYSGDAQSAGSVSRPLAHTVVAGTRGPTSTTIISSENPVSFGTSVTLTATVFTIQGVPSGTVRFLAGSTNLASAILDNLGTTSAAVSLPAGSHQIVAIYDGDANYAESTSPILTQIVKPPPKIPTFTALASSLNPCPWGDVVTVTATVTGDGEPPSGSVRFAVDNAGVKMARLSAGQASVQYERLAAGSHQITATYLGDDRFEASVAPALFQVVDEPILLATTTVIASSANPSTTGQTVTFTATVLAETNTAKGNLQFFDNSELLGTVSLENGSAQFSTSSLTEGNHWITGVYGGDSAYSGSTSQFLTQVVKAPPKPPSTATITASSNPSSFKEPVTFTATVTSGEGTPSGSVRFLDGTILLGTSPLSEGRAFLTVSSLAAGSHLITANYGGDSGHEASSSPALPFRVILGDSRPILTSSANPSARGQIVTFEAQTDSLCSGTVTFLDGGAWLGIALPDKDLRYRLTLTQLTVGVHRIVAVYAGGSVCPVAASDTLEQVVVTAPTATVISVAAAPSGAGGNFLLTAATQVVSPGSGRPSGEIVFQDGEVALGRSNLDQSGAATLFVNLNPAATHAIAARYSGNADLAASSSVRLTDLTDLAKPDFEAGYVGNSASFTPGLSANSHATIFGSRLSGGVTAVGAPPYATALQGVQITLNGRPVQLVFISDQQINFIVPADIGEGTARLVVTTPRGTSNPVDVLTVAASPGIFADLLSGYGAILTAGTAETTFTRPVSAGEYIEIYCTGLGAVDTGGRTLLPVTAVIGGVRLAAAFSGTNPAYAGLYQVNVQVPAGLSGQQKLSIEVDGRASNEVLLRIN